MATQLQPSATTGTLTGKHDVSRFAVAAILIGFVVVVIAAIGPAKWKTGFQLIWQGSAYFWFFAATLAAAQQWNNTAWHGFALFNGIVGTLMMTAAVILTIYSLVLYLRSFGSVFAASPSK